jgi:ATP-dependent DNA helicase RecG
MQFELSTPVEELYLVGPARAKLFKNLGIHTLEDLLFYFPRAHQDLSKFTPINELALGEQGNIKARVLEIKSFRTKVRRFSLTQALVEDDSGSLLCVWFNQPFLTKIIKPGEEFIFSGKVTSSKNKLQLQSPVYEQVKTEQVHTSRLVPLYSLTASLTQKQIRSVIKFYLDKVRLPEYLPEHILEQERLYGENEAVHLFHFPETYAALKSAQERLAFDEIFQTQLRVIQHRQLREHKQSVIIKTDITALENKIKELPFTLTEGQQEALSEVLGDFTKPFPSNRLLQGDVGSGKTIVAALAMFTAAKNGLQAAILAPTEVLANQHYLTLLKLFKDDGLDLCLLTSSQSRINGNPVSKSTAVAALAQGRSRIVIGTHALIEKTVKFKSLAVLVIDEQHRFGVEQRSQIKEATNAHLLTMSATPIPRTLALTLYGDLDISVLHERPAGRQAITTRIVSEINRVKAYEFIAKQIAAGRQTFVICPLIEESDKLGVKSATEEFKKLSTIVFPHFRVGLLHGKLKPAEKESVMQKFKDKELDILVSTSVIEVGVDVPNATVMMIEGSERFGLAQLHQFRGRVGRSEHKSYCFLFSSDPEAEKNPRLNALAQNTDGFKLAEIDLQIRGSGEVYGTKQSGYGFRIATLSNIEMVERSREYAQAILKKDPDLIKHPELKQKLKNLPEVHLE